MPVTRAATVSLALAVASLVLPCAAGADPIAAGPRLIDGNVAWGARDGAGYVLEERMGGRTRRLAAIRPPRGATVIAGRLAGDGQRLLLVNAIRSGGASEAGAQVLAGPPIGPFTEIASPCPVEVAGDLARRAATAGGMTAFPVCMPDGIAIDRDSDGTVDQTMPGSNVGLRLAGRFLARWEEPRSAASLYLGAHPYGIAVYDLQAGSLVYRLPAQALPGGLHDFDLDADGTIVFSYVDPPRIGGARRMRLGWASPTSPQVNPLPIDAAGYLDARIREGNIALERARSTALRFADAGLSVFPLARPNAQRVVGRYGAGSLLGENFDYDGRSITWWEYGCARAMVEVIGASSSPRTEHRRCPLRLREPLRIRGRRLLVVPDCFGLLDCTVVRASARTRGGLLLARGDSSRLALTQPGRACVVRRCVGRVVVRLELRDSTQQRVVRAGTFRFPVR